MSERRKVDDWAERPWLLDRWPDSRQKLINLYTGNKVSPSLYSAFPSHLGDVPAGHSGSNKRAPGAQDGFAALFWQLSDVSNNGTPGVRTGHPQQKPRRQTPSLSLAGFPTRRV
jgi:hypothetical protein